MKHYQKLLLFIGCMGLQLSVYSQKVEIKTNPVTGGITTINIGGDPENMNWIVRTDGSQYAWVKENYAWGLGYLTQQTANQERVKQEWKTPETISTDGMKVTYKAGTIEVRIERQCDKDDLVETYTFTNTGKQEVSISDIGIYTPFNDNYPDAVTCLKQRTHAHIWEGDNAAYVNAIRMGARAPHLGLMVTGGAIKSYEIWERGQSKENSHTRGIITLNTPDFVLKQGQSYQLSWRLFSHSGNDDFNFKLLQKGSVKASGNKYVFEKGETAFIELYSATPLSNCTLTRNGVTTPVEKNGNNWIAKVRMDETGEARFEFNYGKDKRTHVNCLVVSNVDSLIRKRADFIRTHQQMNERNTRKGAYMVYDNETDKIYLNDTPNANPPDRDEGAERMGMGILLAKQYRLTGEPALKESLLQYANFVRRLQTKDYITFSTVNKDGRNRGYNYMWMADFYFQMYKITEDKQYAIHGFQTLQAMFRQFGYGFYAIDIPVQLSLQVLKEAGLTEEYDKLKEDYIKVGEVFVKNSLNYPKSEVNYEQSIVAPALIFLSQLYLETGVEKYLDEVKKQLPVLEAFSFFQPSFHLNDISIRHWDGYWFGKREMWGDTFPHYWSTLTGVAFYYYAKCTGDTSYQNRAENIVRNNLCLFFEDGKASCAYIYPYKVNGEKAEFYDPYANDQDWALAFYYLITRDVL